MNTTFVKTLLSGLFLLLSSSIIAATQTVNFGVGTETQLQTSLPEGEFTLNIGHTFTTDASSSNAINGAGFFLFYDSRFIEFMGSDNVLSGAGASELILPVEGGLPEAGSTTDGLSTTDSYVRVAWTTWTISPTAAIANLITASDNTNLASLRFRWIGATDTSAQTDMALRFNGNTLSAGRGFMIGAGGELGILSPTLTFTFSLDIDGSGQVNLSDGIMIARHLSGFGIFAGPGLTANLPTVVTADHNTVRSSITSLE